MKTTLWLTLLLGAVGCTELRVNGARPDATVDAGAIDSTLDAPDAGSPDAGSPDDAPCEGDAGRGCYTGPGGTMGVGACRGGAQSCADGGWSSCEGQTLPAVEVCNAVDDDCNGLTDDGAAVTACPAVANGARTCVAGACGALCAQGFGDCDGAAANGCESVLASSATHCGICGNACPSRPRTRPTCAGGACVFACEDGAQNCDGNVINGCETDVTLPADCGACGNRCAFPHADATCSAGRCALGSCRAGFADCDRAATNGCEAALNSRAACGACGTTCSSSQVCASGRCAAACGAGETSCAGACADLRADAQHCGACGAACGDEMDCVEGRCVAACPAGRSRCGGACLSLADDPAHCGACDRACAAGEVCVAGACGSTCPPGQTSCDGVCRDLRTDPARCGACANACPAPAHATAACVASACAVACASGFGDCNGVAADGCEVDLVTSAAHCGACGAGCAIPGAASACVGGACVMGACLAGAADCNGLAADGCEVDPQTSPLHCGACGHACAATGSGAAT